MRNFLFCFLLLVGLGPSIAKADVVISGSSNIEVTIESASAPAGLDIFTDFFFPIEDSFAEGGAAANAMATSMYDGTNFAMMQVGDTLSVQASGDAFASDPMSFASFDALANRLMVISNTTSAPIDVTFAISYSVDVDSSGPLAGPNFGFVSSDAGFFDGSFGLLTGSVASTTDTGGGAFDDSGTLQVTRTIGPLSSREFFLLAISAGFADVVVVVPEPSSFALLGIAGAFGLVRRNREIPVAALR